MGHWDSLAGKGKIMNTDVIFYLNATALGVGLAMDAFSVSMANGLRQPDMKKGRLLATAGVFAGFQFVMPLIGWFFVHTAASMLDFAEKIVPWVSLFLLLLIGGKMVVGSFSSKGEGDEDEKVGKDVSLGAGALAAQGIATSIDALSVGFTISELGVTDALTEALIIGGVTFLICAAGVMIGRRFGTSLGSKATLFGGLILIAVGIEIFIGGIFG